jgi:hypothetical protein
VFLVGAIFGFGHFMTPNVNDAWARVVLEGVGSALVDEGVPEFMKMRVDEGSVQEVYLNGNTLFYSLYRTDKSITSLLDYYQNLYGQETREVVPPEAKAHVLAQYPKSERAEAELRIDATTKLLNTHHVRVQDEGWGAFATVLTGKEGSMEWTADIVARFRTFKKTGKVADLGKPKIVVAFADKAEGGTQYFTVWPGPEFDQRNVRPRNGEDAPGYDIEDIARPMHSKRMVTFGQEHGPVSYEILVYRGPGTMSMVEDHFVSSMQADGWGISETFAAARETMDDPMPALLFSKGTREAYVSLSRQGRGGEITSTIILHDQS